MTTADLRQTAKQVAAIRWQTHDRALWGRPGEASRDAAQEAEECGGLDGVQSGIYESTFWQAWCRLGTEAIAASPYRVVELNKCLDAATADSRWVASLQYIIKGPEGRTVLTGTVVLGMFDRSVSTVIVHDWHRETGWRTEEPFVADLCSGGKPEEAASLAVASRVLWLIARDMALAEHEANSERGEEPS